MRALLVIHSLGGGGAERVMTWLATQLAVHGHEVQLLVRSAPETDTYEIDDSVEVSRKLRPRLQPTPDPIPPKVKRLPQIVRNRSKILYDHLTFAVLVRRTARKMNADVVLSFIDVMNVHVALAMLGSRRRVVVSERIDPAFHLLGRVAVARPLLYRTVSAVVVQSREIAARIAKDWRVSDVRVIGNASVSPPDETPPLQVRPRTVLTVGRLHSQKDQRTLLDAWARLGSARDGWELHLWGEGPESEALTIAVNELGLTDSVRLRGRTTAIGDEYRAARIFVLPSRFEGFSNALVEAMSWGCAPIATDCPGASAEILEYGQSGLVVPTEAPEDLARALEVLMTDDEYAARLGDAARRRAGDFDEEEIYQLWELVLAAS